MLATRNDMGRGARMVTGSDRQPTTSPTRTGRAGGSRMRCLPRSRERTWAAHLRSSVAAAVLAVPCLVFPTASVGATFEKSERIDHGEAECPNASWKDWKGLSTSRFYAQNMYPAYGKVMAKVNLEAAMDRTLRRDDGNRRSGPAVQVLDAGQDGDEETPALSNLRGDRIVNPAATGTLLNGDRWRTAWPASVERGVASRLADRLGEHLTVGVGDSHVTLDGLRISAWQSLEEGEMAGIADTDRRRWRDWTWGQLRCRRRQHPGRLAGDDRPRPPAR